MANPLVGVITNLVTSVIKSKIEKPSGTGVKTNIAAAAVTAPATVAIGTIAAHPEYSATGDPIYDWLMFGASLLVTYALTQYKDWAKEKSGKK